MLKAVACGDGLLTDLKQIILNFCLPVRSYLKLLIIFSIAFIPVNAWADLKQLQSKYSGVTIGTKVISRNDLAVIYNKLPSVHPFSSFDQFMHSSFAAKQIFKETGGSCKKQYGQFDYKCPKPPGFIEFSRSGNKISKYKVTADITNLLKPISRAVTRQWGISDSKSFNRMMLDFIVTRFNDVAPKHVKYQMDGSWMIITGSVN